jgi:hypothetical protein
MLARIRGLYFHNQIFKALLVLASDINGILNLITLSDCSDTSEHPIPGIQMGQVAGSILIRYHSHSDQKPIR